MVKDPHRLRIDGSYGVTRHPIYTGLLGMLLGTVLVGVGRSVVIFSVGLVLLEIKLRIELVCLGGCAPRKTFWGICGDIRHIRKPPRSWRGLRSLKASVRLV